MSTIAEIFSQWAKLSSSQSIDVFGIFTCGLLALVCLLARYFSDDCSVFTVDGQTEMIKSVQRQRNLQLWCSGHCPFASIITLLLIYDHDFHLPFPQYQQVVDGMESPSSHFRIGFLPDKLLHCSFHQSASLQNIQHIQHLVHGGSPFRNIKNMRCVRMFMTFWEQGWFSEFVWKPECGEKTENACLHLHEECSSLTVLYSEASFPWRQRGG